MPYNSKIHIKNNALEATTAKTVNTKRLVFTLISVVIISFLTFLLESSLNRFEIEQKAQLFGAVDPTTQASLLVSYNENEEELAQYSPNRNQLPTYIATASDLTFQALGDTFFIAEQGTEFRTLIFKKDKLHLQFMAGQFVLDNRLGQFPITIQTNNILLKPFEKGVFYFDKEGGQTIIESITGQAVLGVYDGNGDLTDKLVLPKGNRLTFTERLLEDSIQIELSSRTPEIYAENQIDLDQQLAGEDFLTIRYKSQNINPTETSTFLSRMTRAITLNPEKRDFLNLYPFAEELIEAKNKLLAGETPAARVNLAEAKQVFDDQTRKSPLSLAAYKEKITNIFDEYVGLSVENRLNPIKTYIIDNHLNIIEQEAHLLSILSYIEDASIHFSLDEVTKGEETIRKTLQIAGLWPASASTNTLDNKEYIIDLLDNLARKYTEANFKELYELREQLVTDLEDSATIRRIVEINVEHLQRLESYFRSNSADLDKLQESSIILLNRLSRVDQLRFEDFINDLNIEVLN